jgi:TPR repeat protein
MHFGLVFFQGEDEVVQDKSKALEYYFHAAELGSADASNAIANAYYEGDGIEKDEKKAIHYYEQAAIQGHNESRYNLGFTEYNAGKYNKALKHWLIASERGNDESVKNIKRLFILGHAAKEDYEKGLRSYREYIKDIKRVMRGMWLQRLMKCSDIIYLWYRKLFIYKMVLLTSLP